MGLAFATLFGLATRGEKIQLANWTLIGFAVVIPLLGLVFTTLKLILLRTKNAETHALLQSRTVEVAILTEQLRMAVFRDPLTGLPNRTAFDERSLQALLLSGRQKKPCSLALLRLDRYATLEADLGESGAQDILRQVARSLAKQVRKSDLLARGTGEEFLLLLPATPLAGALTVAERLRASLVGAAIERDGVQVKAMLSVGVGCVELSPQSSPDEAQVALLRGAETAVVSARRKGGNAVDSSPLVVIEAPVHRGPERRSSMMSA